MKAILLITILTISALMIAFSLDDCQKPAWADKSRIEKAMEVTQ